MSGTRGFKRTFERPKHSALTLAFDDPALEDEYRWDHARRARRSWIGVWCVAGLVWSGFVAWDLVVVRSHWRDLFWMRVAALPAYLAALGVGLLPLVTFRKWFVAAYVLVSVAPIVAVVAMLWITKEAMVPHAFVALILISLVPHTTGTPRFIWALASSLMGLILYTATIILLQQPRTVVVDSVVWLTTATVLGGFASYNLELFARHVFAQRRALKTANARIESLLLNMLPPSIAERLQASSAAIAEHHDQVTVLFGDIVGFTPLAEQLSPARIVDLLNEVFSAFDSTAARLRLEKIKTIGDAYMVAAGLPDARSDHADAAVDMALEMIAQIERLGRAVDVPLRMRIGIHTGPVVAGVIGKHKFSYDLWGDTVNTASRMESHGVPGTIQISEATFRCLIRHSALFETRREIDVKGKGKMAAYVTAAVGATGAAR